MADWRERGYVPDSDDEDEILSAENGQRENKVNQHNDIAGIKVRNQRYALLTTNDRINPELCEDIENLRTIVSPEDQQQDDTNTGNAGITGINANYTSRNLEQRSREVSVGPETSTVDKLQAELDHGLQTVRSVLRTPDLPPSFLDGDDSPLSSLPASENESPLSHRSSPSVLNLDDESSNHPAQSRGNRTFRPRAPIQLHPYALELARYRKDWQERGLPPVRLQGLVEQHQQRQEEGQQSNEDLVPPGFLGSSQMNDHVRDSSPSQLISSPVGDDSQSPVRAGRIISPMLGSQDDTLPEITEILTGSGRKSRKHTLSSRRSTTKTKRRQVKDLIIFDLPMSDNEDNITVSQKSAGFREIPSPPSSGAIERPLVEDLDQSVYQKTPQSMPTPIHSSEKQYLKRRHIAIAESSDNSSGSDKESTEDDSSDTSHSKGDSQGMSRIRRRIKGVLPASWLKLDAKHQLSGRPKQQAVASPEKANKEKGVAHKVSSALNSHQRGLPELQAELMSDTESDSSSETDRIPHDELNVDDSVAFNFDDVVEDNSIDAMIPSTSKRLGRRPKKRQKRLDDVWTDVLPHSKDPSNQNVTRSRQRPRKDVKQAEGRRKRRSKKPELLRLSILDAPGFAIENRKSQPRFLKIGARQRRVDKRHATQSPNKKFFRLATSEDTVDINEELNNWKDRHYKQGGGRHHGDVLGADKRITRPQREVSRGQKSINKRSTRNPVEDSDIDLLKRKTTSLLDLLRSRQDTSLLGQDPANSMTLEGENQPANSLTSLLPHLNRSGKGRLANRINIRPAQIEIEEHNEPVSLLAVAPQRVSKLSKEVKVQQSRDRPVATAEQTIRGTTPLQRSAAHSSRTRKTIPRFRAAMEPLPSSRVSSEDTQSGAIAKDSNSNNNIEKRNAVIQLAIKRAPELNKLHDLVRFTVPTLIGLDLLNSTIRQQKVHSRDMDLPSTLGELRIVRLEKTKRCSAWIDAAEFFSQIFHECHAVIEQECTSPRSTKFSRSREVGSSVIACFDAIDSIIAYNNCSLWFQGNEDRIDFVTQSLTFLNDIVSKLTDTDMLAEASGGISVLLIINRLIVYAYQVAQISSHDGLDESYHLQTLNTWDELIKLALLIALDENSLEEVLNQVKEKSFYMSCLDQLHFTMRFPEVETLVLLRALSHIHTERHWVAELNRLIIPQVQKAGEHGPAYQLAYCLLVICCICPLVQVGFDSNARGLAKLRHPYSGWQMLIPVLESFLIEFLRSESHQTEQNQQLGLVAIKLCHKLSFDWEWTENDNLLKLLSKVYASNDNIELFLPPKVRNPDFLKKCDSSICFLTNTDTDFHVFLKLIAITLKQTASQGENSVESDRRLANRIRSLVFSLSPNNSRAFEQTESLKIRDLVSIQNCYQVYLTLYIYAPINCQPRLSQIESLIDFTSCHARVCELAIRAWSSMSRHIVLNPMTIDDKVNDLAQWIYRMTVQQVKKISQMRDFRVQMETELQNQSSESSEHMRTVMQKNSSDADILLHEIMQLWSHSVALCKDENQARQLVLGDDFVHIIRLCKIDVGLPEEVVARIYELILKYIRKVPSARSKECLNEVIQREFRQIITNRLSSTHDMSDENLQATMTLWFHIANSHVKAMYKNWDDYLLSSSALSLRLLADTELSRQCNVFLVGKIIKEDPMHFEMDKFFFYTVWVESIVQPEANLRFEHILTRRMIESDSSFFPTDVVDRSFRGDNGRICATLQEFKSMRLEIIRHVINHIQNLRSEDADSFDGSISRRQGETLLQNMMQIMNATYRALSLDARAGSIEFINEVVFELRVARFRHLELDRLFSELSTSELLIRDTTLDRLFIHPSSQSREELCSAAGLAFRTGLLKTIIRHNEGVWVRSLVQTFCCTDHGRVLEDGSFNVDISLQSQFLRTVVATYLEQGFQEPYHLILPPILNALSQICSKLPQRIDQYEQNAVEDFAWTLLVQLKAVRKALQCGNPRFPLSKSQLIVFGYFLEFISSGFMQWNQIQRVYPGSATVHMLQPEFKNEARYVYRYMTVFMGSYVPWTVPEDYPGHNFHGADFGYKMNMPNLSDLETEIKLQTEADIKIYFESCFSRQPSDPEGQWLVRFGEHKATINAFSIETEQIQKFVLKQVNLAYYSIVENI